MLKGRIIKSLSGFYTVEGEAGSTICKGRGVFRNQNITPLVGDIVSYQLNEDGTGTVMEIEKRVNSFIRPPIANMTQALIVVSATEPAFSHPLLDRFLVIVEANHVKPIILITKADKLNQIEKEEIEAFKKDYEEIGYPVILTSLTENDNLHVMAPLLKDELTVLTGQSGVGKSTLLNNLQKDLQLETGEISKSLGRGRHTTRHVELIQIVDGYVADTPGFSSVEFTDIAAEELTDYFIEMKELAPSCKFRGCLHDKEPKCAVKAAVQSNHVKQYRYDNYLRFLNEIKLRKPRY